MMESSDKFKYIKLTEGCSKPSHGCTSECLQPIGVKKWVCKSCGKDVFSDTPTCCNEGGS